MPPLTPQQRKRLIRLANMADDPETGIIDEINTLDDKVDVLDEKLINTEIKVNQALTIAQETSKQAGPMGDKGERGDQGERGESGKNGVDGKSGKDGRDGRDGRDGIDGVSGLNGIAGKDGSPDTGSEIVKKINDLEITPDLQIDAKHIKNLPKSSGPTTIFGRSGRVYHDTTLSGMGTIGDPLKVIGGTSGGSGFQLPLTGVVDGSNTTFTWTTAPNVLQSDGISMRQTTSDGTQNWSGTTTTILTVAPTWDLFAIA